MSAASRQLIAFGPFEFDAASGLLYRGEREILLPMRVGKVLEILLLRPGKVLSKDELLGEVWKDAFVGEDSLTQAISMVRSALGDDPRDPTYIQTIPKRGYRFIAEVGVAAGADPAPRSFEEVADSPPAAEVVAFPPSESLRTAGARADSRVSVGSSLGHYEIVSELGAGAMGVVYRARDTKLEREVALKVLPEDFISDPDRVARFEREAKLLAAVSHPNIAAIHSLEEAGGTKFPVLELVEGETLEERLRAGPIKVEEALEIARQITSALEAAHERGIVHRDLKPANIKITPSGQVKVLDFGLAKALEVKVFGGGVFGEGVSESPTESMTIMGSRRGSIVGTAAYMSPEQARGQEAGKQADIWAFGCVLYEMLTGKRAFGGDTVSDTIAGLLRQEPEWDDLPEKTPRAARRVLHRCLTKDTQRRLHDIADARIDLEEAIAPASTTHPRPGEQAEEPPLWRRALPWGLVVGSLAVATGAVLWGTGREPAPALPASSLRYTIDLLGEMKLQEAFVARNLVAVSPDGSSIAYSAFDDAVEGAGSTKLFVRRLDQDQAQARPLAESAWGAAPFFSPDGMWIGFFNEGKLKKVSVNGGAPIDLCEAPGGGGGTWAPDDTIVFMLDGGFARVSGEGGKPEPIALPRTGEGELRYAFPQFLPGGDAIVFSVETSDIHEMDDARIAVLDLQTGEQRLLGERGTAPIYSSSGHLIYQLEGALHAVAFDLSTRTSYGPSFEVEPGLLTVPSGTPTYALSASGTLAYVPGPPYVYSQPVWVDRERAITRMSENDYPVWYMDSSPNRELIAFDLGARNRDLLIYDLVRRGPRLPVDRDWGLEFGTWMPDGASFIYKELRPDGEFLYRRYLSGREEPFTLDLSGYANPTLTSVSPDGTLLAFDALHPDSGWDLWLVPLEGEPIPQELLVTPDNEERPVYSPDGSMIAYISHATGRAEVYVMAASQRGSPGMQVSAGNAGAFRWGIDSDSLYYGERTERGYLKWAIMGRPVRLEEEIVLGDQYVAFELDARFNYWGAYHWDIPADGRLLAKMESELWTLPNQIRMVINWSEELKRLAPTER